MTDKQIWKPLPRLAEAKETDPEVTQFMAMANALQHPFTHGENGFYKNYSQRLMEGEPEMGALRGQTVGDASGAGDGMQVAATLEIFNAVARGYTRYMNDAFVKKYTTNKTTFKIPTTEYQELVADISAGELAHTEKKIDYVTVDLSSPESEKGGKISWTRSLLEDVTFDVQIEMMEGLGFAIAVKIMSAILTTLLAVTEGSQPSGSTISLSATITWAEFLSVIGAVDTGVLQNDNTYKTYGPADYVLVSPDLYWQLLNIIQATNVLYEGSTDPVKRGVIKLLLGCTILKQSLLAKGTMVAVNSQKAVALVTRRKLKIEPVLFPVWNEYGFIGTVRFGTSIIFEQAIQMGKYSAS